MDFRSNGLDPGGPTTARIEHTSIHFVCLEEAFFTSFAHTVLGMALTSRKDRDDLATGTKPVDSGEICLLPSSVSLPSIRVPTVLELNRLVYSRSGICGVTLRNDPAEAERTRGSQKQNIGSPTLLKE
jgi:hypothetical protein